MPTGSEAIDAIEGSCPLTICKGNYSVIISNVPNPIYGTDENGKRYFDAASRIGGSPHNSFTVPEEVLEGVRAFPYRQESINELMTKITGNSRNSGQLQVGFTDKPLNQVSFL